MLKAKAKGWRTVNSGRKILEEAGYIFANLEKTGKFVKEKDLFGYWDVLAIKGKHHIFIQFKTNMKLGVKKPRKWLMKYLEFGQKHGSYLVKYQIWNKIDYKPFQIIECNLKQDWIEKMRLSEDTTKKF